MADNTKIEWADASWSPVTGCSPFSEGCLNCWAKRMANRLRGRFGYPKDDPFKVTFHPNRLDQPLRWKKPRRIFVCSMGDLFHEDVKVSWINEIFPITQTATQHQYLFLTKRPGRILGFVNWMNEILNDIHDKITPFNKFDDNCFFGITAENQKLYDERWTIASKIPAAVRFVSLEPALEHINIDIFAPWPDWVIWGPETGIGKRPFSAWWAESVYDQCQEKNIPFFDKRKNFIAREFPGDK